MKPLTTPLALIITLITLMAPLQLSAGIYKWVDADGNIHFTDDPPKQVEVEKVEIQSFTSAELFDAIPDTESFTRQRAKQVVIYTTTWCGVCKTAKRYFLTNGIRFTEYDVEKSRKGKRDYKKMKGRGVPIILVGGKRMTGFSSAKFEKLYGG